MELLESIKAIKSLLGDLEPFDVSRLDCNVAVQTSGMSQVMQLRAWGKDLVVSMVVSKINIKNPADQNRLVIMGQHLTVQLESLYESLSFGLDAKDNTSLCLIRRFSLADLSLDQLAKGIANFLDTYDFLASLNLDAAEGKWSEKKPFNDSEFKNKQNLAKHNFESLMNPAANVME